MSIDDRAAAAAAESMRLQAEARRLRKRALELVRYRWKFGAAPRTCAHYDCRCARAAELAAMAERPGLGHLLLEAIDVHFRRVTCRRALEASSE